jgi:hypothetical protein
MIDRLILSAVLGTVGCNGLFPDPPVPLTLHQKMVQKSHAKVCTKEKLRPKIKKLCKRWI